MFRASLQDTKNLLNRRLEEQLEEKNKAHQKELKELEQKLSQANEQQQEHQLVMKTNGKLSEDVADTNNHQPVTTSTALGAGLDDEDALDLLLKAEAQLQVLPGACRDTKIIMDPYCSFDK